MTLVTNFQTDVIKITRKAGGKYVDGRYEAGRASVFELPASVQPATGKEVQLLPEGRQDRETITIYTDQPLNINSQLEGTPSDVIEYRGRNYEILMFEDWTMTDLPHYKSLGVLVDPQGDK